MTFTLIQGKQYTATIELNFIERIASNENIADRLRFAGFDAVTVTGDGGKRRAQGTWGRPTADVELPSQVKEVRETCP